MNNLFGTDFSLFVNDKPLDKIPTSLFVNEVNVDTGEITEVVYTTQLTITDVDLEPLETSLTPEQLDALSTYWAKKFEEDLIRQLMGQPSEYERSLRAAGATV